MYVKYRSDPFSHRIITLAPNANYKKVSMHTASRIVTRLAVARVSRVRVS